MRLPLSRLICRRAGLYFRILPYGILQMPSIHYLQGGGHSRLLDTRMLVREVDKKTKNFKIFQKLFSLHILFNNFFCFYDPNFSVQKFSVFYRKVSTPIPLELPTRKFHQFQYSFSPKILDYSPYLKVVSAPPPPLPSWVTIFAVV